MASLLVAGILLWLPGGVLLAALRRTAGWASIAATAPLVSLALVHGWALVLQLAGAAVTWTTVLVPLALVTAVAGVVAWRGRATRARVLLGRTETVLLLVVSVAVLLVWAHATSGFDLVPPNDDGTHHGLFAARILALGSIEPSVVGAPDVLSSPPGMSYYPLALHTLVALGAGATGLPVGSLLTASVGLVVAVSLPWGVACLTRRLFPGWRWAAPAAGLAAVLFPALPWYPVYWGGLTIVAGMAALPALLDVLLGAVHDDRRVGPALAAGLALVGMAGLHTSEVVTAVLVAAVLVVADLVRRDVRLGDVVLRGAVALLVMVPYVVAQLGWLRGGQAEREGLALLRPVGLPTALADALTTFLGRPARFDAASASVYAERGPVEGLLAWASLVALWALLVVGVVATVRARQRVEWLLCLLVVGAVTAWSAMGLPGAELITIPWYSRWDRVVLNELPFLATYLGVGAAVVAARLVRGATQRGLALATGGAVLLAGLPQVVVGAQNLSFGYAEASLAGDDARAAWSYLREHARPGERVLDEFTDGSGWMYAVEGLAPVFPGKPTGWPADSDRRYLLAHAAQVGLDARARKAADELDVEWLYVGPRVFPFRKRALDIAALRRSSGWEVVFEQGGATVLRRTGSPT